MNLFDIWTRNRARQVSELVASSFLNYILNPSEDHGLGPWFALELIGRNRLSSLPVGRNSILSVYPEQSLGAERGRIDTLISIQNNEAIHLVGVEVKIHDKSANNVSSKGEPQISRYYELLEATLHNTEPEDKNLRDAVAKIKEEVTGDKKGRIVDFTLAYIVPRRASAWPSAVTTSINTISRRYGDPERKKFVQRLRIVPWVSIDPDDSSQYKRLLEEHDVHRPTSNISELLGDFLNKSASGLAAQPDSYCLHFIRCLRHAAERDFLAPSPPVGGKHATQKVFENSLEDSGEIEIFSALCKAVRPKKKLSALANNTTIGVRYADDRGGSVFRIRTVTDYGDDFAVLDHIQLEFQKELWEKERLRVAFKEAMFNPDVVEIGDFKEGYHADAQGDRPVFIVPVKKCARLESWSDTEKDSAIQAFERFHQVLTKMVPRSIDKTGEVSES